MQSATKRKVRTGSDYTHLFPQAEGIFTTIKPDAGVGDTLTFIQQIVPKTLDHTSRIAEKLKADNVYETCRNIWQFVYDHIAYRKDQEGYEQVRSPARSWMDRKTGVDCDCYTTFISSILCNLHIPHKLRVTKYSKDYFQHIYPIVPNGGGYITIDCVTDQFNFEVPFSEKKDVNMDLQYLNGFDGPSAFSSADDYLLNGDDQFGELGLFGRRKKRKREDAEAAAAADPSKWNPDQVPGSGVKKKRGLKKILNIANKVNPATLLLRNGVLASMKLNIGKVASRLRWSYISPNQARAKGMDMGRYQQLVKVRQKLENIFYGAGGNPVNLKNAILRGKGNKDKAVNGLLGLGFLSAGSEIDNMNIYTPLPQLLGTEIYYSENLAPAQTLIGLNGFGALGEPITLASVAAAAAVIAGIVGSLKKIGDVFKGKKTQGSDDFSAEVAAAADKEAANVNKAAAQPGSPATFTPVETGSSNQQDSPPSPMISRSADTRAMQMSQDTDSPAAQVRPGSPDSNGDTTAVSQTTPASNADTKTDFWSKNKRWLLPVVIGVGSLTIIGIGMKMMKPAPAYTPGGHALHGLDGHRKRRKRNVRGKTKGYRKKAVALL
ncbi:MAG TPA: hypothetical protein VM802_10230 [Chitinophaga sp.]|uniref:hypothetical protein n=1 Tax=Chitinophaga sp. TaxID=1869181 RepID=UPI002BA38E5F|nr:hypothetical protein [Chitinophaga sp.]HVI45240.1 hypothetical protein [Chitinophaga sp.]